MPKSKLRKVIPDAIVVTWHMASTLGPRVSRLLVDLEPGLETLNKSALVISDLLA